MATESKKNGGRSVLWSPSTIMIFLSPAYFSYLEDSAHFINQGGGCLLGGKQLTSPGSDAS